MKHPTTKTALNSQHPTPYLAICVLMALLMAVSTGAHADEPPTRDVIIMIDRAAGTTDATAIERAVSAQVAGLPVTLETREISDFGSKLPDQLRRAAGVGSRPDVLAVFWYDRSNDDSFYLYLKGSGDGPTLVRNVGKGDVEPIEAAAIIVRSSVGVLLQGGTIAADTTTPVIKIDQGGHRDGPQTPPKRPEPPPTTRLRLETAYQLSRVMGTSEHGAAVGVALPMLPLVSLWSNLAALAPTTRAGIDTRVETERLSAALGMRLLYPCGWGDVGISAGLTAEYLSHTTSIVGGQTRPLESGDDLVLIAVPAAWVRVELWHGLHAFLSPGAEVVLTPVQYVVSSPDGIEVVVGQARVAPWLSTGVALDLF